MKNQIRIKNKNKYEIEVNDNGDTISFNLDDPELPLRFDDTFRRINDISSKMKAERVVIEKKKDEKTDGLLTKNERALYEMTNKYLKEMRKVMDGFLGEGACDKIFGNANFPNMYEELLDQLQPHFAKMKLDAEQYKKAVEEKYKEDEDEDVLS